MSSLKSAIPKSRDAAKRRSRSIGRPRGESDRVGREAIVAAARALLLEVHYKDVTRSGVAKKAGVSPGLIRYYFDDLQMLLTEVVKQMMREMRSDLAEISKGPGSAVEKLRLRMRHLAEFLATNPAFHQLFTNLVIYGDSPWANKTRREFTEVAFGEFAALGESAKRDGSVAEGIDLRFLYILIIGGSESFAVGRPIFEQLFEQSEWDEGLTSSYADFFADLVLRGIEPRRTADE